jgi:hypothetical protein
MVLNAKLTGYALAGGQISPIFPVKAKAAQFTHDAAPVAFKAIRT